MDLNRYGDYFRFTRQEDIAFTLTDIHLNEKGGVEVALFLGLGDLGNPEWD